MFTVCQVLGIIWFAALSQLKLTNQWHHYHTGKPKYQIPLCPFFPPHIKNKITNTLQFFTKLSLTSLLSSLFLPQLLTQAHITSHPVYGKSLPFQLQPLCICPLSATEWQKNICLSHTCSNLFTTSYRIKSTPQLIIEGCFWAAGSCPILCLCLLPPGPFLTAYSTFISYKILRASNTQLHVSA